MSFAELPEAQHESPLPHEPDIGLCVVIAVPNTHELKFVVCMPAAIRFAMHCVTDYPAVSVTFEAPSSQRRRLPCERLWALP